MKKLKKKGGFTLVELIVVIAIIAVLAAILIPTMIGYVIRSRVNNMNATAGKMREHVSYFLTQANADGYGMVLSRSAICDIEVIAVGGVWSVQTSDKSVFVSHYSTKWTGYGTGTAGDTNASSDNAEARLASHLANTFKDVEDCYASMRLVGGVCNALYFTTEQTVAVTEMPDFDETSGWSVDTFEWNERNQGITESGIIVGTSPLLLQ